MSESVAQQTTALLGQHCRTSWMHMMMSWTCRCGHWCASSNDMADHQAAVLTEAGLVVGDPEPRDAVREVLAVVVRSGATGSPSAVADNLADAQLNYLAACGYRIVGDSAGGRDSNGERNG